MKPAKPFLSIWMTITLWSIFLFLIPNGISNIILIPYVICTLSYLSSKNLSALEKLTLTIITPLIYLIIILITKSNYLNDFVYYHEFWDFLHIPDTYRGRIALLLYLLILLLYESLIINIYLIIKKS